MFYSNIILNTNRKSASAAPAAEGTLWNFIPAGRLGYYLARRVCRVFTKALHSATTERKEEKERECGEKERTCLYNRYMKHCDRGSPERIAICIFRKRSHALASSRASVCTRYLSSVAVYHLILLFHSSKFKHFIPCDAPRFVFPLPPRDDAQPDNSIEGSSANLGELVVAQNCNTCPFRI